ncbi:hypothetical protein E2A64_13310 [Pseudohoeflea suaedae]|uniref:Uncharacterized protein n=1 Tax=Pseudohoeflea suaedae TaxID=877384 RepID=A0A4R5PKT1_9HYPH|nr:hypothetical protein [Pseudohoeflea suaedae]TDH36256.1 hypothetical protein E2A64_13310 [Pseudohoeflea suaedae]
MTTHMLVIGGVPTIAFDRLRKVSSNRLAPGGKLILSPNPWKGAYHPQHAHKLITEANAFCASRPEKDPIVTLLIYVDFADRSTTEFLNSFFPFSLPYRITLPNFYKASNGNEANRLLGEFEEKVLTASAKLREVSALISHETGLPNLNPLLLPRRNFRSQALDRMLRRIFDEVMESDNPKALVEAEVSSFHARHPWLTPPGDQKRCLSDGQLFFKSPGKHRHGFFRNSAAAAHNLDCLLNARSRLGGSYDYCFHFDCEPVRGKLRASYENCHGGNGIPKEKHVNIAPNDYVV